MLRMSRFSPLNGKHYLAAYLLLMASHDPLALWSLVHLKWVR